ncbi:VanZ family protein [Flavobacteriaceae bacterium 3-367]|uniref:VanZ family protein n=1 Tax=Eudoraea algarum TaxID=3417568 RepID=UPI00327B1408
MVFITLLSLVSFPDDDFSLGIEIPHMDKLTHLTFYFVATVLGYLALWEMAREKVDSFKALGVAVIFAIFYGILIEGIQSEFTTHREGDFYDVLANTLGALLGAIAIKLIFSGKRRLKWKN